MGLFLDWKNPCVPCLVISYWLENLPYFYTNFMLPKSNSEVRCCIITPIHTYIPLNEKNQLTNRMVCGCTLNIERCHFPVVEMYALILWIWKKLKNIFRKYSGSCRFEPISWVSIFCHDGAKYFKRLSRINDISCMGYGQADSDFTLIFVF